jgi:Rad52/22 family double-strand break repair protein
MGLSQSQIGMLRRRPSRKFVRTRNQDGKELHYLEGWHAIAEANRIFGHDRWNRETVWFECVWRQPQGGQFAAAYLARVRIVILTDHHKVIREGSGAGEAIADTPGKAHELAAKAAETDATKRALSTFGNPFGLSLYGAPEKKLSKNGDATAPGPTTPRSNGHRMPTAVRNGLAIDKSELSLAEPKRLRNKAHLKFVAYQPCLICGRTPSHAHHLTFAQPRAMGRKVSDEFVVPVCNGHHREIHDSGDEMEWWQRTALDPLGAARELWSRTIGDL